MSRRRSKFTSPQHVKDTVTAAYSTTYNTRNLEEPLYTPFHDTMDKLTDFPTPLGGTISVRQQHNLLCSKEVVNLGDLPAQEAKEVHPDGYSDNEPEDGVGACVAKRRRLNTSESSRRIVPVRSVRDALRSYQTLSAKVPSGSKTAGRQAGPGNISARTMTTVPGGRDTFPDIVICHTCVVDMEKPEDTDALVAWNARLGKKVSHQCFPAIAEIKRAPSRALRGTDFDTIRDRLLDDAITDLSFYMSIYFSHDRYAKSVIGIAGAGAWWQWRQFKRAEIPPPRFWDEEERGLSPSPEEEVWRDMQYKISDKFSTAPKTYLGTEESDLQWDKLQRLALIRILETHRTDYPWSIPDTSN
ncbi:hypothetical protein EVG20_g1424 [Dentipellis fragilis]|uniref:Uncharacterized protein n=1 Tax=Dentipellis fragilis TaxID=205917 RepID=A0A4Y9ZCR0_9AGAM|nr:hypothetical protein EVG20_g1424 [Dentipellis fragilis]